MTRHGNESARPVRLTYESPKQPVGRHGSLVYLRDEAGRLTVMGPHSDALQRWLRVKQVLAIALGAGAFMTAFGGAVGGLRIDLTQGSLDVQGNMLARVGVYVTLAAGVAILVSYLLLGHRPRNRVTIVADRDGLTYRLQTDNATESAQRWPVGDIVGLGGDTDGGLLLLLKDRRQVKLYIGRNYGESMRLADDVYRALGRSVAEPAGRNSERGT